jgi:replicative DNA helicase
MEKKEVKDLGYLGYSFQIKLVKQMIEDVKFSESIIDIISPNYFDNEYIRLIIASVKDYKDNYETIPTYETINQIIKAEVRREIARESALEMVKEVINSDSKDCLHTQEVAIKFCKQQELKKANQKIQKILDTGDFDRYEECEEILKQALTIGDVSDNGIDVFHAIEDVLSDDFRSPIQTGIVGLDNLMDGGLSKGELGVILAPFGVGKTTLVTRMANTAYNLGYNVVQIFFEDNPKVIQRKHLTFK